ncbi:hypothetical protein AX17_006357 [Amanita inopinata Kibby_2008]|nr:hypothetical protein AX17_006357 [Amanita inopinata Kibby_2008]
MTYFDAQYEVLRRFRPEIVGHIDLCRLYRPELCFADFPRALEKLKRNIRFANDYGALFEVNTAAFRKRWETAYPGRDVIKLIYQAGGRFALSDDSHGPHTVGLDYNLVKEYLVSAGITELWYLERSSPPNSGGRKVRPAKFCGDWWNHAFWMGEGK